MVAVRSDFASDCVQGSNTDPIQRLSQPRLQHTLAPLDIRDRNDSEHLTCRATAPSVSPRAIRSSSRTTPSLASLHLALDSPPLTVFHVHPQSLDYEQ
jgi:hypothetical protein